MSTEPVHVAEFLDPVAWVSCVEPAETAERIDAGAALTYAMYHTPAAQLDWITSMPKAVMLAYMRACDAYKVDSRRR